MFIVKTSLVVEQHASSQLHLDELVTSIPAISPISGGREANQSLMSCSLLSPLLDWS
jgi:hypothetical protein